MELRHLRYFVAVAEELSFRRAAERVRVAQPALSKQIKDLEHELGVRLLSRNTAGVALTDAGSVFLAEATALLDRASGAVKAAREADAGRLGSLNIANVSAISASFMPATLSAFRTKYPDVDVNLHELPLTEQIRALEDGIVQVGFSVGSDVRYPAHLERFKVLEADITLALSNEHSLARNRSVSIHDLKSERILCFENGSQDLHRKRIASIFERRGATPGRFKPVNSLESLQAMIEGNQGVSFLAAMSGWRRGEELVFRPLKERGSDLRLEMFAVFRKRAPSQLARNFVNVLRDVCGARNGSAAGTSEEA